MPLILIFLVGLGVVFNAHAQPAPEGESGWRARTAVETRRDMVVAAHPLAVQAGVEMLAAGGSATDAAIAAQWVLGLVEPQSSGLGGGGFFLYYDAQRNTIQSIDGRETAPASAQPQRFLDTNEQPMPYTQAVVSGLSVGVPGLVRALEMAHAEQGRLPWAQLFAPAIALAEHGFQVTHRLHTLLSRERWLRDDAAARALFYDAQGAPRAVGAVLVNRAYANTLRAIAQHGAQAFYTGPIANDMVQAVQQHPRPGDMRLSDLQSYRAVRRAPVCGPYRQWRICSMAPPSAGGVAVLQLLGFLERTPFASYAPASEAAIHVFSEAGRLAYADRARWIADPNFVSQPTDGLLEPAYLQQRAQQIGARSMGYARPGLPQGAHAFSAGEDREAAGTTQVSVVDTQGNAVSLTSSIESQFGSRIFVRGFLLNNQLTDFSFVPRTHEGWVANRVEGGKRPRSSMAPTLVFDAQGQLTHVLGSPGGPAIINYVAKTLVGLLDWKLDVQAAIDLPNVGSTNGPTFIERGSAWEDLGDALSARGHVLSFRPMTSGVHAIERIANGWRGGADPRREGQAAGH